MMTTVAEMLAQAAAPAGSAITRGTLRSEDGSLVLLAGGVLVPSPRWVQGYFPADGDNVLCARVDQSWYVLGLSIAEPDSPPVPDASPPPRGSVTAAPVGSSTITINAGGTSYECGFLDSYTPTVGHTVRLLWAEGEDEPLVLGRAGRIPTPQPPPPPPPPPVPKPPPTNPKQPPVQTGRSRFTARDSGSYMGSAWNSYFGRHLMQGSVSGPSNRGAWFYGSVPTSTLRNRTATSARLRLGARRRVGNYNQSVTIQVRRHTSRTRGSNFPSVEGATLNVTLPSGAGARWIDIPNNWAQEIIDNGGGIAIVGSSYGGIVGTGSGSGYDAQSGLLEINWRR